MIRVLILAATLALASCSSQSPASTSADTHADGSPCAKNPQMPNVRC